MTRPVLLAFALLSGFALLFAGPATGQQTGTIKGTITHQGKPLTGAIARAIPGGRRATTGADGRYQLTVTPGAYTIECRKPGFAPRLVKGVQVPAGGTVTVDCALTARHDTQGPRPSLDAPAAAEEKIADVATSAEPSPRRRPRPSRKVKRSMGAMMMPPSPPPPRPSPIGGFAPPADREGYDAVAENDFQSALKSPLSTFSIDVDTASYANVRRLIDAGRPIPKGAVRIEEFINYFSYAYPDATGEHPFSVTTEIAAAPWNPKRRLVHIGLQGKKIESAALPRANLVFLLDVSGSMNSPAKLPLLKKAFKLLVQQMRPQDSVAIVVYAGAAGVVLPPTPGDQQATILNALENLRAGGSTAGGAGIKLAYQIAADHLVKDGNNRVILATDGDFNVGASSDSELVTMIEQRRNQGIFLTILGFGSGNYQDAKMEKLADKGNGNAAYIDSLLEAKKVLVTEMGGTLLTIAKDVKLQVEFNPAKVKAYRLIGYENRMLKSEDFNDDKKDAGELGAGHTVTALYEIIPAGSDEAVPGVDALKYQTTQISDAAKRSPELMTLKLRYKPPTGDKSTLMSQPVIDRDVAPAATSPAFRFSAAVAAFGMLLRDSAHKGASSYDLILGLARGAKGPDAAGYRAEFIRLVEKAQLNAQVSAPPGGPKQIAR